MPNVYPGIISELCRQHWAITDEALDGIKAAVTVGLDESDRDRFHSVSAEKYGAIFAELGDQPDGAVYSRVKGRVGSLFIGGPIVPRASAFLESSGVVSISRLTAEFRELENDDSVETILLIFDSPGGAITGISEFAAAVAACNKETMAYAYGSAQSAAYWIASAADKITASPSALVGSIGTLLEVRVEQNDKLVTLRNTQSPKKGLDASTEEGRSERVKILDDLAEVFINTVAANRGVTVEKVMSDFGQGAPLIASRAKEAGMIDEIGTLAGTMVALENTQPLTVAAEPHTELSMSLHKLMAQDPAIKAEIEAMVSAARKEGATAEREKVVVEAEKTAARNKQAMAIATSDTYPKSIKDVALGVIAGEVSLDMLKGAQIAYDAIVAQHEENAAVADSNEQENVVAAQVVSVDTSGRLETVEAIEAEIAEG